MHELIANATGARSLIFFLKCGDHPVNEWVFINLPQKLAIKWQKSINKKHIKTYQNQTQRHWTFNVFIKRVRFVCPYSKKKKLHALNHHIIIISTVMLLQRNQFYRICSSSFLRHLYTHSKKLFENNECIKL